MRKSYWTRDNFPIAPVVRNPGGAQTFQSGTWRTLKPIIEQEKCTQCGRCQLFCPDGVIDQVEGGEVEINYYYCKGCGICAKECPRNAFSMVVEGEFDDTSSKK